MAYATESEVQSEFKRIDFSAANAAVASAEVDRFINEASAIMDAKLSARYVTPITADASALLVLKRICICMVKDRVVKILRVKTGEVSPDQDTVSEDLMHCMQLLDELASGKSILSGSTLSDSTAGVKDYNYSNDITQTFDVEDDQW